MNPCIVPGYAFYTQMKYRYCNCSILKDLSVTMCRPCYRKANDVGGVHAHVRHIVYDEVVVYLSWNALRLVNICL